MARASTATQMDTAPPQRRPFSLTVGRLGLVLVSTAFALGVAEIAARCHGVPPQYGRILPTDVTTRMAHGVVLWDAPNPRSNRDDIRRAASDTRTFKIAGLGDSIMYGVFLPKEQTYLEQTRELLTQRSGRRVEVLNLAVPGFNTMQENAEYQDIADTVRPDLVIVHFWGDDVRQYRMVGNYVVDFGDTSSDGKVVVRALPVPPAISDFLLVHSNLYALLTHAALTYRRNFDEYDWTRVTRPLSEINDHVRSTGGRLIVLASADLSGERPHSIMQVPALQRLATASGFDVVDLTQWLGDRPSKDIAIDACHFNAEGHRIIAQHLADYLLASPPFTQQPHA